MRILIRSHHRDAKWIARWFKRANSSASKSRLQTDTVGGHLSRSQTAPAMMAGTPPPTQSVDGSNHAKSPSENLAEPTTSGTGTSPGVFSAPLEHTYLFSRSGVQVAPENGRSAIDSGGHSPYHGRLHSSGWELEHPAVAPDLQGNRELERPLFFPYSHGTNPVALPRPHTDLVDSQLPLGGIVTDCSVYLASQALPPFRHDTSSSPNSGTGIMDNVKSRNDPHTSPSPASVPPGPLQQTPTRYVHVNLVSERSDPAYPELQLGTHVDLSSRAQAAVPHFVVAPTGSRLGPSEPSAPLPSMYWLLFDTELDSVVDGERDDVVSRSSSGGMLEPHVTPTPISFFAKWEDMLALERRIRSSAHNTKLVQSKRIHAVHTVEPNRTTRQQSGTGKGVYFSLPSTLFFFMERADAWSKQSASTGRDR